jgi:hypothetical protein
VPRRAIDPVDTIWLNMDRGDNLMVIESLMMTSGRLDPDRLAEALEERVLSRYPVFRQGPMTPWLPRQAAPVGGRPGVRPGAAPARGGAPCAG